MNNSKNKMLLSLTLLTITTVASAQQSSLYGGVSVGQSNFKADASAIETGLSSTGSISGISGAIDSKNTGFKLRLGYQLSDYVAVEGGYIDFGKAKYSGSYTLPGAGSVSGRTEAGGVNVDVLGKLPINREFAVFGKAGILLARTETNASSADGSASVSSHATTLRPGLGGGVDYALSSNVGLRTEWERYFKVGNNDTGKGDVDLLSVGLNYRY